MINFYLNSLTVSFYMQLMFMFNAVKIFMEILLR